MRTRALLRSTYLLLAGIAVTLVLLLAALMRPIADDYCYAAGVRNGLWSALMHRYLFEGGNLFETLVVLVQVGLPLVVLPLWVASGLSWLLTLSVLYGAIATMVASIFPGQSRVRAAAGAASVVGILWLPYWWMPALVPGFERMRPVFMRTAKDMLFWHSMQSQYIVVPALALVVVIWVKRASLSKGYKTLLLGVVGVCVGLSSLILGGGMLLTLAFTCLTKTGRKFCLRLQNMLFIGALLAGIAFQISAPGTFGRLTQVEAGRVHVSLASKLGAAFLTGASQFPLWAVVCTANVGLILAVVTGFLLGRTHQKQSSGMESRPALRVALWLYLLGFALLLSEKVLEALTYFALWHLTYARLSLMAASVVLGVWLSQKLPKVKRENLMLTSVGALAFLSLTWTAVAVGGVSVARANTWASSPHAEGDAAEATYKSWVLDCAVSAGIRFSK